MARKTGLKGLQEWAKHVTQTYSNVEITNMTSSFRDGLAFCAIIHRYRPDLIPYNSLKKGDVLKNNQLAFSVAEKELDIPALLDAEDMVALSVPDKLSVATYLVQYYNYFKDKAPSGPSVSKFNPLSTNPLVEPSPPTKRTKVEVETIGPATVSPSQTMAATKPPPHVLTTDKKTVSSPALQHPAPPTHKPLPLRSPPPSVVETAPKGVAQDESSSKEGTPEPTELSNKVKKGRRSKFKFQTHGCEKNGTMGMEVCDACGERVFLMERLSVEGHIFHRACFKCYTCHCLLKPGSYEHDSKGDMFYCQPHYREALRQSTLKRTMQQRGLLNGDDTSTEVKRKKEEQTTSTTTSESSPGHEITKDESLKIRSGLPGLLKSLAENKHEPNKTINDNMTSSEDTSSVVKMSSTAEPTSSVPAKPPPPKPTVETSRSKVIDSPTKGKSKPPKPPTVPPRRPTWSPNVQFHDVPKRPAEPPKVPIEPPRRPTWSPKLPYEPPKRSSTASTEASRVLTEAPNVLKNTSKFSSDAQRRPTWSPKTPAVEGERSHGQLPKSTVAWITKGKVVDSGTHESSPKVSRHSTVSGIPAKPSPPLTTSTIQSKVVTIEEDRAGVTSKAGVTSSPGGSTGPVKPPRRKKTTDKQHLPMAATAVETDEKIRPAPSPSPGVPTTATKMDSIPKKHPPPRPSHQPSLKMRNRPGEIDIYAACEQRHKKRLGELRRELKSLEQNQLKLEAKGIQLERQLRAKDIDVDDHLMEEWFSLVNEKNMLLRQESDLVYELRDLELIEQHDQLEKEIRQRVTKDDSLKSEMEKLEEEAMIAELVELVEKRDKLLWALHLEKGRDEEEDKQVELIASVSGYALPKHLHRSKTHI